MLYYIANTANADFDWRSSMKTANANIVELEAGGGGCHGQSKFDGYVGCWLDVGDGDFHVKRT
jgi:hypothetical protein